jgi:peptidoglycan/LPS O-acetylase OafA/YrhL
MIAPPVPLRTAGYQPHIDGLRALAIVLVLLFHFDFGIAPRGFLGVDIFFVLSGYLVGGHVLRETAAGRFNLADFFVRRIARILPALVAVSIATLVTGYFILLPDDYSRLADSIRAAMLLVANQHFANTQDYFGPGKYDTYFLHSWSLSIEEQFYLFFPLFALCLAQFGRKSIIIPFLALIAVVSLGLHWWLESRGHVGGFYYLSARAWQLLAGVLIAAVLDRSGNDAVTRRPSWLAWLGLALAAVPAFAVDIASYWAEAMLQLSTVIGTGLVLYVLSERPGHRLAMLLGNPIARFVGLISYSLYLVHWPLLTLAKYWFVISLSFPQKAVLLGLSFLIAFLSWRLIEMPVRQWVHAHPGKRTSVIASGLITIALVALAGAGIHRQQGLSARLPKSAWFKLEGRKDYSPLRKNCHSDEVDAPIAPERACKLGAVDARPEMAVWSDSHGVELAMELGRLLEQRDQALVQFSSSSCPPLLDLEIPIKAGCKTKNSRVLEYLGKTRSLQTVLLVWHHNAYLDVPIKLRFAGFQRSVASLVKSGKRVIVIGPIALPGYNVPSLMARSEWNHAPTVPLGQSKADFDRQNAATATQLANIARKEGAIYFDSSLAMCGPANCPFVERGKALYFDDNHLSLVGARKLAERLLPLLLTTSTAQSPTPPVSHQ